MSPTDFGRAFTIVHSRYLLPNADVSLQKTLIELSNGWMFRLFLGEGLCLILTLFRNK